MNIAANIKKIVNEINLAKLRSNRTSEQVNLVVVTKNRSLTEIQQVLEQGYGTLGENRVQELKEKYPSFPDAQWHLIGHLQRNKVKYITDKVQLVHSLDSLTLAQEINKKMESLGKPLDCLVQVNIAEEESKHGIKKEELTYFLKEISPLPGVNIKGLMTIAPEVDNPEEVRPVFRELYRLFEFHKSLSLDGIQMRYLSMGMTNDYQVAVEEGSNMVRIGSAIFGPRY
ncbi:MAG: YggS family pyridoxal phosphate-dependent enzyme [Bacillota bacterium]